MLIPSNRPKYWYQERKKNWTKKKDLGETFMLTLEPFQRSTKSLLSYVHYMYYTKRIEYK